MLKCRVYFFPVLFFCFFAQDWTSHILRSLRTEDPSAAGSISDHLAGSTHTAPGTIMDRSWREALLHLRHMYPMGKTVRERLEVGLGSRIIEMRQKLAKVSRDKSAKQRRRAQAQEGVVLECDASDGEPNIYADNVVNLVRKARHRERRKHALQQQKSLYSSDMRSAVADGADVTSKKRLGGTLEADNESDEGY